MNYKFVLIDSATGNDKMSWVLPLPVIIGRSPEAQVSIGDPSISRRHCQFSNDSDGALVIRDLESMNGTYVDELRVNKSVLRPSSMVRIGALTFRIEWTTEPITDRPKVEGGDGSSTQPMSVLPRHKDAER